MGEILTQYNRVFYDFSNYVTEQILVPTSQTEYKDKSSITKHI